MKSLEDLRKLDSKALQKELYVARKEHAKLIIQKGLGGLKQTHKIKLQKRYIAYILSTLSALQKGITYSTS